MKKVLKGILIFFLLPFILVFGWIAGIIWFIFFRRKLQNDSKKQKKYSVRIAALSALSLLCFAAILSSPSSSNEENTVMQETYAPDSVSIDKVQEAETTAPTPAETAAPEIPVEERITATMYPSETVNIRSAPDSDSELLGTYLRNEAIDVISSQGQWTEIAYNGNIGYVFSSYLSSEPFPAETQPPAGENDSDSPGNNNFNTYDNEEQQQTEDTYVLNTSSKKIHYPSCSSVPRIAPQNYSTSSLPLEELLAQGYTTCGNCFR